MVLNFKGLNKATTNVDRWPIPYIEHLLRKIGALKPKYFAVMDLTSGFFQAPIDPESARYTAFTTWFGNFQFTRVAMGLKGAPAFFQQKLATEVLGGLIHSICELYLDDLNVYADTLEEYIKRIRLVLTRFREHGIIVNPKNFFKKKGIIAMIVFFFLITITSQVLLL
jgi:hypothetical protein